MMYIAYVQWSCEPSEMHLSIYCVVKYCGTGYYERSLKQDFYALFFTKCQQTVIRKITWVLLTQFGQEFFL